MLEQQNSAALDAAVTAILRAVLDDVRRGMIPGDVLSFSELHEYVDANDYLSANGVPNIADDPGSEDVVNAVLDAVDRRLLQRELTDGARVVRVGSDRGLMSKARFVGLPVVVHPWSGAPARGTVTDIVDADVPLVHLGGGLTYRAGFPLLVVVEG